MLARPPPRAPSRLAVGAFPAPGGNSGVRRLSNGGEVRLRRFRESCGILAPMERDEGAAGEEGADLVRRARRGDAGAFDELVRMHVGRVWRVVWKILRHHEDAEDVVQEVFMAARQALEGYRSEASFTTWLHRIAVNKALNHRARASERLRRAAVPLAGEEPDGEGARAKELASEEPSALQRLEESELAQRLATCLEALPREWRALLALRIDEELSYAEIASATGTAIGTVRSRLSRARLALRRCLGGEAS